VEVERDLVTDIARQIIDDQPPDPLEAMRLGARAVAPPSRRRPAVTGAADTNGQNGGIQRRWLQSGTTKRLPDRGAAFQKSAEKTASP
jgi:hypothetical protein